MKQQNSTQDGAVLPLHLEMNLVSSSVMLGEPIVLHYKLTSTFEQEITVQMGRDRKDWITMKLENSSKTLMPPRLDPRLRQGGLSRSGVRVSAKSPAAGYIVVSQQYFVTQAENYDLRIDVLAPYEIPFQSEKTVLTQSYTFPLVVTEAQPTRLRAIAELLRETAAQAGSTERRMSIEALFSMPEEYAFDSWRAAASDPRLLYDRFFIADQLERLSTIAAAEILAEMVLNTPLPIVGDPKANDATEVQWPRISFSFSVDRQFHNLYFHSDLPLKAHLTKMYMELGWAIPDKPILIID